MSATGVVMLDPDRLTRLMGRLQAGAEAAAFRRRCVEVALEGTGHDAPDATRVLGELVRWCRDERSDVLRRSLLIAALPATLPLPPQFLDAGSANAAAKTRARRIREWLDGTTKLDSDELTALFAEVVRNRADTTYMAGLFRTLGPKISRSLAETVHSRWPDSGPGEEASDAELVVQQALGDGLGAASRAEGADRLGERWFETYAGLDPAPATGGPGDSAKSRLRAERTEEALKRGGYGVSAAKILARGAGAGTVATVLNRAGGVLAVARVVPTAIDYENGDATAEQLGLQLGAAGLAVVAAVASGPVAWAAAGGAFALGYLATLNTETSNGTAGTGPRSKHDRRKQADTGEDRHRGGGRNNSTEGYTGDPGPRVAR